MQTTEQNVITQSVIDEAMTYEAYRELVKQKVENGKTTGPNQSEALAHYTKLNERRMNRLDKTVELNASLKKALKNISQPVLWLVITEGWCGDAAQNVPVINKMAEAAPQVELKFILRDEHTDIMDHYLTNGGRSIPKLVCLLPDTLEEIGTWGPRPGDFQRKAMEWKDDPSISKEEWGEKLHKWYAADKSQTLQSDFEKLIEKWS